MSSHFRRRLPRRAVAFPTMTAISTRFLSASSMDEQAPDVEGAEYCSAKFRMTCTHTRGHKRFCLGSRFEPGDDAPHGKQGAGDEAEALREQNGESDVHMTHPGGPGSGVKKLIRLPSGSRNSIDRLPQG
jgi:hypothetical protein